jgi:hypothetical protein
MAITIELYFMEPLRKRSFVNRSMERVGMKNVLLTECWGEGVASAERLRSRLLLEEEQFVEQGIPLCKLTPESGDDLPNWVGQVTRQ